MAIVFVRRYMVGTQFEAAAARKAFPCMDEPTFKQTFTATLWKQEPMIALSNMPVSHTEPLWVATVAGNYAGISLATTNQRLIYSDSTNQQLDFIRVLQ